MLQLIWVLLGLAFQPGRTARPVGPPAPPPPPAPAVIRDLTHNSQALGGPRVYQAILPGAYVASQKRYPVIYWLHGYEQPDAARDAEVAAYVTAHDVIVIKAGPVETTGTFAMYLPELTDHIDRTFRTIADREHRGLTGYAMGGFMALWIAAKYPDQVGSASAIGNPTEAEVGPDNLEVESRLDDLYANYGGVRTHIVTMGGTALQFYHARLNRIWSIAAPAHEIEAYGAGAITRTLDFHLRAFAKPLPKPASFRHADVFPNFSVWKWDVLSSRKQPGYTVLDHVSARGFRSSVREWIPGGATIPSVRLSVISAPLYQPGSAHSVMYVRLRDGNVRRAPQKADAQGRLAFDLDGDDYEVGISAEPDVVASGYEFVDAAWATAGAPLKLRVKFWNVGAVKSGTTVVQWESPSADVKFEPTTSRVLSLGSGESATVLVSVNCPDKMRRILSIVAAEGANRMEFEAPVFPAGDPLKDFQVVDGRSGEVYLHGVVGTQTVLGDGNGDGHAAPGERFALLLPDGDKWRLGEIFTNDSCVDNTMRLSDSWEQYDHAGASDHYSLALIRKDCQPGHVIHMLARMLLPGGINHEERYFTVDLPVWWRPGEEPRK